MLIKDASSLTSSSAQSNGEVTDDGGGYTERGFEYYKDGEPENVIEIKEMGDFGKGNYGLTAEDLLSETKYYFRAYVLNATGVGYGSWRWFTTLIE